LEPGVEFFVLMLEQLGAVTEFSCEGHPHGFYIMFHGPYELAWRLSLDSQQELECERDKAQILRRAATAWERDIGRLKVPNTHSKRKTASAKT
jgi:hypothetical protein